MYVVYTLYMSVCLSVSLYVCMPEWMHDDTPNSPVARFPWTSIKQHMDKPQAAHIALDNASLNNLERWISHVDLRC